MKRLDEITAALNEAATQFEILAWQLPEHSDAFKEHASAARRALAAQDGGSNA